MSSKKYLFTVILASIFVISFGATSVSAADDDTDEHGEHHGNHDGHHDEMKSGDGHKHHGKCNMMSKVDADDDGRISLREFMKHHREMFDKADTNNDRFIDKDEMQTMMKHMHGHCHDNNHGH